MDIFLRRFPSAALIILVLIWSIVLTRMFFSESITEDLIIHDKVSDLGNYIEIDVDDGWSPFCVHPPMNRDQE